MFGSVLRDVYRAEDREAVHYAIDDLCSPSDNMLWASVGVYCYFDPYANPDEPWASRALYVGEASDLPERFASHNGLSGGRTKGNKWQQVQDWFGDHEFLGIALLPQSPLAQTNTHRERKAIMGTAGPGPVVDNPNYGKESMQLLEGQLIEAHRLEFGGRPAWNNMGASIRGQALAPTGTARGLLPLIDGRDDSLLCARHPIRCLSNVPHFGFFEAEALHLARMIAVASDEGGTDLVILRTLEQQAVSTLLGPVMAEQIQRIKDQDYLRLPTLRSPFDVQEWAGTQACL